MTYIGRDRGRLIDNAECPVCGRAVYLALDQPAARCAGCGERTSALGSVSESECMCPRVPAATA